MLTRLIHVLFVSVSVSLVSLLIEFLEAKSFLDVESKINSS